MQTVSQRLKLDRIDTWLLSVNVLLVFAFNLSLYFLFVSTETQWLGVFWILLWTLVPRRSIQKTTADESEKYGDILLSLITVYSLLNGLSYMWGVGDDYNLSVMLQCFFTLIVGITMSLALIDQTHAGSQIDWPVVICSYCVLLMTVALNLAGLWIMLTTGV